MGSNFGLVFKKNGDTSIKIFDENRIRVKKTLKLFKSITKHLILLKHSFYEKKILHCKAPKLQRTISREK